MFATNLAITFILTPITAGTIGAMNTEMV